jgi:hypothetical protein
MSDDRKCVVCEGAITAFYQDPVCPMCDDCLDSYNKVHPHKHRSLMMATLCVKWAANRAREKAIEKASKWLAQACINYEPVSRRADIVWFFEKHMSE